MALALFKKMLGMKAAGEEENVAEKVFGNIVKFRVGSSIQISPHILQLWPSAGLFNEAKGVKDYGNLVVEAITSFEFGGTKVWRLICTPECIIQIQEEGNGQASYMLFLLTQEEGITKQEDVQEWRDYMANEFIKAETGPDFVKVFGTLEYVSKLEADGRMLDDPSGANRRMSLFDRLAEDTYAKEQEYLLFDLDEDDWYLETFVGINIPTEEVKIS